MSQGSKTTRQPTAAIQKMLGMGPSPTDRHETPQEHLRNQLSRLGRAALQNPVIQAAASDLARNRPERIQAFMNKANVLFERFSRLTEHLELARVTPDDLRNNKRDRPAMR